MLNLFGRPFPIVAELPETALKTSLAFGTFVTFFLNLYPPFGLGTLSRPEFYYHTIAYGVLCTLILLVNFFLLPRLLPQIFRESSWTVGKHICFTLFNILCVAAGNIIYTSLVFGMRLLPINIVRFFWITLLIGAFPSVILTLIQERRLLRRNIDEASKIAAQLHDSPQNLELPKDQNLKDNTSSKSVSSANPDTSSAIAPNRTKAAFSQNSSSQKELLQEQPKVPILFEGASVKERFEADASRILCLQASDNYVTVFALSEKSVDQSSNAASNEAANLVESALLRMTLKYAEERIGTYSRIIRCHKSYIVNLDHVQDISGNAQGYKLHIPSLDFTVPVSRSYQERILTAFEERYRVLKSSLDAARKKL